MTERVSVWGRIVAAVRYVLALEPVRVQAIIRAVLVFAALVGINVTEAVQLQVLAIVAGFYLLVEVITTSLARSKSTPDAKVVEVVEGGQVLAGPASELPTGQVIRDAGSLNTDGPIYPQ